MKQPLIDRSSTKAEYCALAQTTSELLWVESLLNELVVTFHSPTLVCGNLNAILLSVNPILHGRIKDIELDIHFVRERVIGKRMKIQHVSTSVQVADTHRKLFGTTPLQDLRAKLKVTTYIPP